MGNCKKVLLLSVLLSAVGCSSSDASGVNMQPGMWEWTMTMDMPGMPMAMPPTVYSACLTKEDLVPKQPQDNQNCQVLKNKASGNSVEWKIECVIPGGGKSVSEGKMTYSGTTARGETKTHAQGMEMSSTMSGRRTGECK